ncbi:MAG: GspE/PulE family protein [Peptoniphilaceae bacterium]|nr:GspE/PulE family protein [Peptoniphilaceae bacterium]MDY6019076.1 GspE/PulE family protein [Anaerococcus sp.]
MLNVELINTDIDRFIEDLLDLALIKKSSDIHIEGLDKSARIRLRIDGKLKEILTLDKDYYLKLITKIKLISKMDIAEKRRPQDSRLSIDKYPDVDFRISSINTVNGEKIVIRVLSFEEFKSNSNLLGFTLESKEKLKNSLRQKSGMIIFSGPTGSGKSTSLYTLLNNLNSEALNIVTIEDPVEYKIKGINQIAINEKIGLSFANGLRSILRQDPDVIMIGEIRDTETAQMAIRSAITGHLVLTTLHTKSALSSIIRLKDLGIDDYLLSSSINTVASQRLVRKLCDCKKQDRLNDEEYRLISKYKKIDRDQKIYRPVGCDKCNDGYLGREAVEEVFILTNDFKEMIKDGDISEISFKNYIEKTDFRPMIANGFEKVLQGKTSLEEVVDVLYEFI